MRLANVNVDCLLAFLLILLLVLLLVLLPAPVRARTHAHVATDDLALDALVDGVELVVPHEEREQHERRAERDGDGQQDLHGLLVAPVDGHARGRAGGVHGVVARDGDVAEDVVRLSGADVRGEVSSQLGGDELGPDGARDGGAHGAADLDDGEEDGGGGGDLLVARGGLHAELGGHDEHAAADAHGDLRAHEGAHGRVHGAVADHEPDAEQVDERARRHEVLVAPRVLDQQRHGDGRHRRREGEGLRDVPGCGDRLPLHDEEVRVEVGLDREVENNYDFVLAFRQKENRTLKK